MRRLAAVTGIAGIALIAVGVLRRASFLGGGTFTASFDPALLDLVLNSPFGANAATRGLGLLAAAALIMGSRPGDAFAWLGSAAVVASFALAGHVVAEPRWLLSMLIMVHAACIAYWLAALPGLWIVTRSDPIERAARIVHSFGRTAQWSVGALVVAGSGMLILMAGSPTALAASSWGVVIALKLLAFVALLSLAAWNKLRLTPALLDGDTSAAHRLRRSIAGESTVFVLIFLLTAVLTTTAPPAY
jgi:putative copper resistance protein D